MAKILIYGNTNSPLVRQRGVVGKRAGHEIFWFSPNRTRLLDVNVYSLPRGIAKNYLLRAILEPYYLWRTIRAIQPDLIHVHYASKGLAALPLSRFHPLVVTTMGSDILPAVGYRGMYAPFIKLLLDQADCITAKSDFMDAAIEKIGTYNSKLKRVTWGTNLKLFRPDRDIACLRKKWQIVENEFVVFDPRSARPLYNKHVILDAFARLLDKVESAVLIVSEMSSKPAYLQQLHEQADSLGITGKVRFVKTIPYEQMADYYNLADVTVSVPSSDGLPQTLYEAFACGSFLVTGDLPQYQGIIEDKVNVRIVPVGDAEALTEALVWIHENAQMRSQVLERNRAYVKSHADFEQQADYMNEIYQSLLLGDNASWPDNSKN